MLVFNDPTSPTPYPVDAKGPVHHPQFLRRGKYSPGFLQLPSGRQREAALTPGCLGMYCYANVNFTRGCWVLEGVCLFCQQKQQKVQTWSSLLLFVTGICNYAFSEKGKGGERGKKSICIFMFFQFLCPWYPHVWEGSGGEARQVSIVRAKGTSQILPFGRSNFKANAGGSAMPVHHCGAGLLVLAMQC